MNTAMRYERDFLNLQLTEDTVLSLGKFDGLHRGHELLMKAMLEKADAGLKAAVFTFDIPPESAVSMSSRQMLTTNQEKRKLFEKRGVDCLIECPFTREVMHMEAETFIREVAARLRVKWMVVGTDFRFGHNRRGDCRMLKQYADIYGYRLLAVPKMQHAGRDISSTFIREEIGKGSIELANQLLGYPYFIQGKIIHGNQLGRTIGFPTINIKPPEHKFLPLFGVYASRVSMDGRIYSGITNIGRKPTVHGAGEAGVETHIFDFHEDVYGKEAKISLLRFVRPEMEFAGMEQLKAQLQKDAAMLYVTA